MTFPFLVPNACTSTDPHHNAAAFANQTKLPVVHGTIEEETIASGRRHHFVLVHGMNHGAWCSYRAATVLRCAGHRATALDMAVCGVHPARVGEVRGFEEYWRPLLDALAELPPRERAVLVAHSHGGYSVALAMERFPEKVAAAVFVAASMPAVGRAMGATSDEELALGLMLIRLANAFTTEETVMRDEKFLTAERYGSARRVCATVEDDRAIPVAFQRHMIAQSPGVEVEEMPAGGADHMAMLSRAKELAEILVRIASGNSAGE